MKKIISGIIFVILILCFIFLGTRDYKKEEVKDNILFSGEYEEIDENNIYTYVNATKVLNTIKGGSGIIFLGFKSNMWTGYYANILNEVAIANNLEEIYYYDFFEDRKNNNGTYETIVENLKKYIITLDDGTKNLYAPTVIIIKNGEILYFDEETAMTNGNIKPKDYWTSIKEEAKKLELDAAIKSYLGIKEVVTNG